MKNEKSYNIIYALSLLAAAVLTGFTLWDVCKSDGAGIYLAIMWNAKHGLFFDIAIWLMIMTIWVILVLLPLAYIKSYKLRDFFKAESFVIAFMPVISVGNMMHVADGTNLDMIPLNDGEVVISSIMEGLSKYLSSAGLIITLMIIMVLFGFGKITKDDMNIIKSKAVSMGLLSIVLAIVGILIPGMTDLSTAIINYMLVFSMVIIFDKITFESSHKFIWVNLLCLLGGAYRMIDVLINTHIANY